MSLVVHDWGAVGLAFAQRRPERIERLVLSTRCRSCPATAGTESRASGARQCWASWRWARPTAVRCGSLSRESNATPGPLPEAWLDTVLDHFDQGTQRAILRLYRSSPPEVLAAAGGALGRLDMPALVVWGMRDPYIPARFAARYAGALADAELLELADAGHGPWLDRPDVIERVVDFLTRAVSDRATRRRVGDAADARAWAGPAPSRSPRVPAWTITAALGARVRDRRAAQQPTSRPPPTAATCSRAGFTLWDNGWYGGHHLPAYSLLAPGARGADRPAAARGVSMTVAAALFAR